MRKLNLPRLALSKLASLVVVTSFVASPALQLLRLEVSAAVPETPETTYGVLAAAPRSDVFTTTSGNATTNSNGSEWYLSPSQSMGFALGGDTVNLSSADVNGANGDYRLSWHLSNSFGGYRAGNVTGLNDSTDWQRYVFESNSPDYYPSGPQTNVPNSDLTGWSLCFTGAYADYLNDSLLSAMMATCDQDYILFAAANAPTNKIEVTLGGDSVLEARGGNQAVEALIYPDDNLNFSLYEPDLTTNIPWNAYRVYLSSCTTTECDTPTSPLVDTEGWDSGTLVTDGAFTVPEEADQHWLAVVVADDETGDPVNGNIIFLNIRHVPTERTISDCEQLQAVQEQLADNYTLTNNIDCSDTVNWNEGDGFTPLGDSVNRFIGNFDGHGYAITDLYINRSSWDYVGLFGVIEAGSSVHDLTLSNVNITGSQYVGALAGILSGTATNVNSSGNVLGEYSVGGLVGEHDQPLGTGSSSPLVYTWNGEKYTYVADVGRGLPRNITGEDYAPIDSSKLAPKDDKYSINISEEYNEIVYYDELALMTFDHVPGYQVLTSLAKGQTGQFYTASETPSNPLQSCTDQYGNDCLNSLQASDDQWSYKDNSNENYYVMNFGNLSSASRIQLLLQGASDYATDKGSFTKAIQVKDAEGNWVDAYSNAQLSTMYGAPLTEVVDMTGKFPTSDYSVKVVFGRTRMNYIAVDTSAPVSYTMNTVHPTSANLQFRGYSAIDKTYYWNHDFYNVSPQPEEVFANQVGNFTKYGDVAPLLQSTDDHPVVIHNGDNMDISFDYTAPAGGMERSFVLYNWATFKHAKMGAVGLTVNPIPHQGMSSYPEAYPLTESNLAYLKEWNTRVVTGRTSGGSTIINSFSSANVQGYEYVGGLVGYNDDTKLITGSYATGDVDINLEYENYGYYMGGLVGENDGTIEKSYATGNVTNGLEDGWYTGGLIGENYSDVTTSYALGDVTGYGSVGGFMGYNDGTVSDTFSRGTVTGTNDQVGGHTGYNDYQIYNSYTTSIINADDADEVGAFIGYNNGDMQSDFWDNQIVSSLDPCSNEDCSETVFGKSTADMKLMATFTTDLGEGAWDFEEIWALDANVNDGYPMFIWRGAFSGDEDGIPTSVEQAGPNAGDANGDGIPDDAQYNVSSFPSTVSGSYVALEMSTDCHISEATSMAESGLVLSDAGFDYQSGLVNFTADCGTVGYTAEINLYFYGITYTNLVVRKYDSDNDSYSTIDDAVISHVTIGGQDVVKVTYQITDGGDLDQDHTLNGVIVDPVGLGGNGVGAPNTGIGGLSKHD